MKFHGSGFLLSKIVLLLAICLPVHLSAFPQPISLSLKNGTIRQALNSIGGQAGYNISYSGVGDLVDHRIRKIYLRNVTLDSSLDYCLKGLPLTYSKEGKIITIALVKMGNAPTDAVKAATPIPRPSFTVHGIVLDENKIPIISAVIQVEGEPESTITGPTGEFILTHVAKNAMLFISHVSMDPAYVHIAGKTELNITMKNKVDELSKTSVITNGYQNVIRERATGSFTFVNNFHFNRVVSSNILEHLENTVPGLLSFHGSQAADGSSLPISRLLRGVSSINSNTGPLIVVDNFPYSGDINNINPDDIESVSILKDAAAASIWGARAANGVIIYATKKGRTAGCSVVYSSSFTYQQRPDIFNVHSISSPDFIDFERRAYDSGYYNSNFVSGAISPVTPVIELLHDRDNGLLSASDADAKIAALKLQDVRKDISKYLYRASMSQQHFLQVSGKANNYNYLVSAGWDQNLSSLAGSGTNRITVRSQNDFDLSPHFGAEAGISYSQSIQQSGNNPGYNYRSLHGNKGFYPYAQLADGNGNALAVNADYSPGYLKQTAGLGFYDWSYRPAADIANEDNKNTLRDYLLNLGSRYRFFTTHPEIRHLDVDVKYQYEVQTADRRDLHTDSSYYARDLENSVIQVNPVDNSLTYPISAGGILDINNQTLISQQGRAQINYGAFLDDRHDLSFIAGVEASSVVTTANTDRFYGYADATSSLNNNINYNVLYPTYLTSDPVSIPNSPSVTKLTQNFFSYFANGAYSFRKLYTFTGSFRIEKGNLFGATSNQNGVPLWSAGAAWDISKEEFYHLGWLSFLKFRGTLGTNGNVSQLASASTAATFSPAGQVATSYPTAYIVSPGNKKLKWEQVKMWNIGLDFKFKGDIVAGTLEYYQKNAQDLMAPSPADPTLGLTPNPGSDSYFYGNVAGMKGQGIDLQVETQNLRKRLGWSTYFVFSYANSHVTRYLMPQASGNAYLNQNAINPVRGKPVYSIYSYKWMGLDAAGNPQGYYNGKASTDWNAIYNNTRLDSMVWNGSAIPTLFGNLRNTFTLGNFSLSVNISYKFNYYFRRPSINYSTLFTNWTGSSDYSKRWQQPGDERKTIVPSFQYPDNPTRNLFYLNSSALVDRADNIRLEDLNLGYELDRERHHRLPFRHIRLYGIVSNLGPIWKANKDGIDPYDVNVPKDGKRISIGTTIQF